MKMKAALMYGPNDIRVEETEKPLCPPDGLILKIMAVGLCGSDIRNLTTDSRKGEYPFIYGHEIVGVVDETGPDEKQYKIGDRLFLFPGTYCMAIWKPSPCLPRRLSFGIRQSVKISS